MAIMALLAVVLTTDAPAQAQAVTPVTVWFNEDTIQNLREGTTNTITVKLSEDPGRELTIPITVTALGEASSADYSVSDSSVTFEEVNDFGDVYYEDYKSFEIEATDDADDDGESIVLGFGTLPQGVTVGEPATIRLDIIDDGSVFIGLVQVGIAVDGIVAYLPDYPFEAYEVDSEDITWQWQRSATEFGTYSDISAGDGGASNPYTPSANDVGKWLKATVTFDTDDDTGLTAEVTSRQPVLAKPAASNAGHYRGIVASFYGAGIAEPVRYAQGFTTGSDSRGYVVTGVRLALNKSIGQTVEGTWAIHGDDGGKPTGSPLSAANPILNEDIPIVSAIAEFGEFSYPDGVALAPDTEYWIVVSQTSPVDDGLLRFSGLSDFFANFPIEHEFELDPGETVMDLRLRLETYLPLPMDPGSEAGWSLNPVALNYWGDRPPARLELPELRPWGLLTEDMQIHKTRIAMRVSFLTAPPVTVEFADSDYDVTEGGTQTVTVELSADPERTVTIPITATGQDGATDADYSVPAGVTFNAGETSKTITFEAVQDDLDDDDETVKLEFGTMPDAYVTAGTDDETVVSIEDDDDPAVTVQFGQAAYTVAESDDSQTMEKTENEVEVTVTLSADPERMITIPVTSTGADGATGDDYSVAPASVTFDAGETSKTVTFTAKHDTVDDDGERVKLGFGTMPDARVTTGLIDEAIVSITDDDHPEVKVQFGQDTYLINEGQTVNVTITLDADPERTVEIPITKTNQKGASDADYDVPGTVTFNAGETQKTIAFMATDDMDNDDDEEVKLTFGTMPDRVTAGTRTETVVKIVDDDLPEVTVTFSQSAYTVAEGATQVVTVTVSDDPERTIIIPIDDTPQGTGTIADYSGVPESVTFTDGGSTSTTFTFMATQDLIDDDGESVKLEFGTMPDERVSAGATDELTLTIADDDMAAVVLNPTSLALDEEDAAGAGYTVVLATEPTVNVTVTVSGHAGTDLTLTSVKLVSDELTFTTDNWNTPQAITLTAAHDDDGVPDRVTLTHTATGSEYASVASELPVTINDNDPLGIVLTPLSLELEESESADYAVSLATEPTQAVTVTITDDGDSDLDLSETTLTFTDADWNVPQTVTLTALHDEDRDDEAEVLAHTGAGGEYAGIASDLPVSVEDNTGDLRLVEGTLTDGAGNPCEGRLEIYYDGQWGTICDDYWDKENADVACRALGFAGGSIEDGFSRKYRDLFPAGDRDQPIWLDDVKCTGGEAGLLGCSTRPVGRHNCRHAEDVGLRCIKSDGPFIVDMEFNDPPGNDGSYDVGDTVEVTVVWSEPVTVKTTSNGHPALWLVYDYNGKNHRRAYFDRGSDSDRTVFTHTIEDFGNGTSFPHVAVRRDALYVADPGSLSPPGSIVAAQGGIPAILGHRAYRSDGVKAYATDGGDPASIERVPAISDPGLDGAFGPGETVEISFVFSRPVEVDVSGGTPSVQFLLGGAAPREAQFARGSGTLQLVFSYTLGDGDGSHRSILLASNSLALNGGAIRDTDNDLDADIAHEGTVVFFLDVEAPTLQSATVDGSTLTLAYSETLDNTASLSPSDFAVTVNGSPRSVLGAAAGQGNVILFVSPAVVAGDTVTVSYTAPTDANAAKIQDESRNPAASFSGQAVTNNTAAAANNPATGAPAITGTAQVGEDLAADTSGIADSDGLTNASFTYQWLADDVDIDNATGTSYTLTTAEQGKTIKVRVSFTDDAGNPESLTSPATAAVAAAEVANSPATGAPAITGTAQVGEALAADTSGIADSDGLTGVSFTYQWLADDVDIANATGSSYTLTNVEQGKAIKVQVSFTDDAGNPEVLTSAATAAVAAAPEPEPTPLTATVHDAPDSHQGSSGVFTFELRFSEAPRSFSYTVLRDHAFTVTGGAVTKARRLEREGEARNIRWEISVTPHGDGPVTVVLPPTTDCEAEGAICTTDGRMLSGRLEFIVPGPEVRPSGSG